MAQALSLFAGEQNQPPSAPATTTPLMAQYFAIKQNYPDYLLFFRLGDFYELFFDDAVRASAALDIALTKRGRHKDQDIPMCGVPWHQSQTYLAKLIRAGFRVAICDQVENPAAVKGGKTLIERKVVRVITPGTVTEEGLLESRRNNYVLSIAPTGGVLGLAWVDVSTGAYFAENCAAADLASALARIEAGEILLPDNWAGDKILAPVIKPYESLLSPQPPSRFNADNGAEKLRRAYAVGTLDGIGEFSPAQLSASNALLDYISLTQQGGMPALLPPQLSRQAQFLQIDAASARNLELRRKLNGEYSGSLLWAIDRTMTGAGARLLDQWIMMPLTDPGAINARLDAVEYGMRHADIADRSAKILSNMPDLQRALARLVLDRGNPRDLASLRDGLIAARECRAIWMAVAEPPAMMVKILAEIADQHDLIAELQSALAVELPVFTRDGNFIAQGYRADLDHLRELRDDGQKSILSLQTRYAAETGIAALKIRHNNILGYFIEVPPKSADKMPPSYIHRQTMASAVRYTTPELNELEQKLARASAQMLAMEIEIFDGLVNRVKQSAGAIQGAAHALARLDVFGGLARLALEENYRRPMVDDSLAFDISGGRHAVVEQYLRRTQTPFIANDCRLQSDDGRLWLITGPNMAGKSTYLRQNALIAIMAQIGSFVPAEKCHIGVVDKIFSRVGAADDLARGQSTFMVEMVETATILNGATAHSLVILDEIGRGTATFDGLSIAWAVLEYLHDRNQCRGLFATHYHELTALAGQLAHLRTHSMQVKEWQGDIIFLHQVAPGHAQRSYGIHVAKLAGLPVDVVARARQILADLETGRHDHALPSAPIAENKISDEIHAMAIEQLMALSIDDLSPRAAWDILSQLQSMIKKAS